MADYKIIVDAIKTLYEAQADIAELFSEGANIVTENELLVFDMYNGHKVDRIIEKINVAKAILEAEGIDMSMLNPDVFAENTMIVKDVADALFEMMKDGVLFEDGSIQPKSDAVDIVNNRKVVYLDKDKLKNKTAEYLKVLYGDQKLVGSHVEAIQHAINVLGISQASGDDFYKKIVDNYFGNVIADYITNNKLITVSDDGRIAVSLSVILNNAKGSDNVKDEKDLTKDKAYNIVARIVATKIIDKLYDGYKVVYDKDTGKYVIKKDSSSISTAGKIAAGAAGAASAGLLGYYLWKKMHNKK